MREGVPDKYKREVLLKYFNLSREECESKYKVVKDLAGPDVLRVAH